jgi:hypothetical protein
LASPARAISACVTVVAAPMYSSVAFEFGALLFCPGAVRLKAI